MLVWLVVEIALIGYSGDPPLQALYLGLGAAITSVGVGWIRQTGVQRLVCKRLAGRPLSWFFVLANLVSWIAWAPLVAAGFRWKTIRFSPYLHLAGGLGPLVAAIVVTAACDGRVGLARVLDRSTAVVMTSPAKGPLPAVMGASITICGLAVPLIFGGTNLARGRRVQPS